MRRGLRLWLLGDPFYARETVLFPSLDRRIADEGFDSLVKDMDGVRFEVCLSGSCHFGPRLPIVDPVGQALDSQETAG